MDLRSVVPRGIRADTIDLPAFNRIALKQKTMAVGNLVREKGTGSGKTDSLVKNVAGQVIDPCHRAFG
jgi:hypothetical protein